MTSHSEYELLTVEQFAERLQVSRTTVFGWLKNGVLRERLIISAWAGFFAYIGLSILQVNHHGNA